MRRVLWAAGLAAIALVDLHAGPLVGALRFTNGVDQRVTAAASSAIDNLGTPTVVLWASVTTTAPAAQRNFFGKSSGNNNWVGFINSTTVGAQYGDAGGTSAFASATFAQLPYALIANTPIFWVFQNDVTTTANNNVGVGYLSPDRPVAFPSAYTTQRTGGNTGHNDSASQFIVGNAGLGGTTNTLPGTIYSVQVFNRILSLQELRLLQYRWTPRYRGCVVSYRLGVYGTGPVVDECNQLVGTPSGSPVPTGAVLPRVGPRRGF